MGYEKLNKKVGSGKKMLHLHACKKKIEFKSQQMAKEEN